VLGIGQSSKDHSGRCGPHYRCIALSECELSMTFVDDEEGQRVSSSHKQTSMEGVPVVGASYGVCVL
jgi:hypothetical protein